MRAKRETRHPTEKPLDDRSRDHKPTSAVISPKTTPCISVEAERAVVADKQLPIRDRYRKARRHRDADAPQKIRLEQAALLFRSVSYDADTEEQLRGYAADLLLDTYSRLKCYKELCMDVTKLFEKRCRQTGLNEDDSYCHRWLHLRSQCDKASF